MNAKEKALQECKDRLREIVKPGDTIYTVLRHVSRSGMYRVVSLFVMVNGAPRCIDWLASQLLEGYDRRHEGCKVGGCGMDTGFHLVHNLSYALYPDGFTCTGEHCPSNEHSNKPYPPRDGKTQHTEGGYSFGHRWM